MNKRKNITTWSDCEVITRKAFELVEKLMNYQKYTYGERQPLGGDQDVMVAAIVLRTHLDDLIEKSRKANESRV